MEKDRVRTEYQEVLENSMVFEKRIRSQRRGKSKQKGERVAELEVRAES